MLRIILSGCHGRMGRHLIRFCAPLPDVTIAAGFDRLGRPAEGFPVFQTPALCHISAHALVDFSAPDALSDLLAFCVSRKLPLLIAATGHSPEQLAQIRLASHAVPILRAPNLSVGACTLHALAEAAARSLGPGFSASITERHHAGKADAPSGTALSLAEAIGTDPPICSIRAGTIAGEHTVLFAGYGEVLELTHRADSREVYAAGAIRAAQLLSQVSRPGLYTMEDLLTGYQ